MNSSELTQPELLILRWVAVRFTRSGNGLPDQASWPFTKLTILSNLMTVKLFWYVLKITPDNITSIEEYSLGFAMGQYVNEHGFHIALKTPVIANKKLPPVLSVDIAPRGSSKGFDRLARALQLSGFPITYNTLR